MRILYINEAPEVHERYLKGLVPSHWFYGAIEMEKDGHEVIWCKEDCRIMYDLTLVLKHNPDIIFLPNLNLRKHFLLLLLVRLHIVSTPVYAYLHHTPKFIKGLRMRLLKYLFGALRHVFFLSDKSMYETIERGFVKTERCSVPGWGADRKFYDKVETSDNGYFISTGKENRDFDILIEAFCRTGAPLIIMTARTHANNSYTDLETKCKDVPNIKVELTEDSSNVYPVMLKEMAQAKALVCPLRQERLDYCVGLSTIADAEGLRKPLIITRNPYHSEDRMANFDSVTTVDDWVKAIERIRQTSLIEQNSKEKLHKDYSMQNAYTKMKKIMNL